MDKKSKRNAKNDNVKSSNTKKTMQKIAMQKSKLILRFMCLCMSILFLLYAEHGTAKTNGMHDNLYDEFDGGTIYNQSDNPNNTNDSSVFGNGLTVTPLLNLDEIEPQTQKTQKSVRNIEYSMTDAKHKLFKKDNNDYALADTMLNFTWDALKKQSSEYSSEQASRKPERQSSKQASKEEDGQNSTQYNKDSYAKNLAEQRLWVEKKRNEVASSFSVHLSESNAFTLAIVARTQEIAEQVFASPEAGIYLYDGGENTTGKNAKSKQSKARKSKAANAQGQNIQGGHIVVSRDGKDITITGQSFAKSGNTCEIEGKGSIVGRGWASFTTRKNEKFYILFAKDSAYIVHGRIGICGEKVSFQGMYTKKAK